MGHAGVNTDGINETFQRKEYYRDLWQFALPISLQCLLQSSFSVVDQVMIGQLGSVSIAAVGLGGKFISLLTVMIQAIAAVAGIILAQAIGKGDKEEVNRGFGTNLALTLLLAGSFTAASLGIPEEIMGIYSKDEATVIVAAGYLRIYAFSFLPMALTGILSSFLRCMKETMVPLVSGLCAAALNTVLNYAFIYGKWGFPMMEARGAAAASVISQAAGCLIVLVVFIIRYVKTKEVKIRIYREKSRWAHYIRILLPLFVCEFLWVLGENVYGFIYGHMGTKDCAAMTLINPVVSLMIGALSGVAQAAGIMMGRLLGAGKDEKAYITAKKLMRTGLIGSVTLSVLLVLTAPCYVQIYNVEPEVRAMTQAILIAFAVLCPVKVGNMILGGGIIRSGGKTKYVMLIDMIGTWGVGVPLGFLTAFVFGLPIVWVYFILSLEELVRLTICFGVFRRKVWMQRL